jgi:ribosomal protein S12 methylthiotransferase
MKNHQKSIYIETLGCTKNRVDSEIMLSSLVCNDFGFEGIPERADIIIVNTCGFLTSAASESIERILELAECKRSGRCTLLIAVGCLIERYKDKLQKEIPEIDGMLGTTDYTKIVNTINNFYGGKDYRYSWQGKPLYSEKNSEVKRILSTQYYGYLKIAEGCSNSCSFCNIPKLRGRQVSRSISSVERDFSQLLTLGVKEINLISQDCSSYGVDLSREERLFPLIKKLLTASQEDFWIRIFYTYPNRYPLELFDLMNDDPRLVPYVDLPFQHVADPVLKAMNRKIDKGQLEQLINYAGEKVEGIAIRSTFIVGFPNETEKDFEELLEFVKKGYFSHVGVFTYSHEDNIKSYKMGDKVPEAIKTERRDRLMLAQQEVSLEKNRAMVGQIQKVLVEGEYEETELLLKGRNQFQGVDIDGIVLINEGAAQIGQFNQVKIEEAHPYDLIGKIIN